MGNSKIFFQTTSSAVTYPIRQIDFHERVSDLQITPYRVVSDSVSMGGSFCRIARRSGMRVRIVLERFTDDTLAEELYSFQSHLEAGGGFSFAVDSEKMFAAFVSRTVETAITGGTVQLIHDDRLLSEYLSTPSHGIEVDDVLHLSSFGPGARREEVRVISYDEEDKRIGIGTGALGSLYNHPLPAFVRHRDFFPFLIWPEDQTGTPILTHDHRISYTLDFTCEVYPGAIASAYGEPGKDGSNLQKHRGLEEKGSLDDLFGSIYGSSDVDGSVYVGEASVFDKMLNDYDRLG